MANVSIPGQGGHDVVYVATENDSVHAFDADHPGAPLWHASFIAPAAGITTVPTSAAWQDDLSPQEGITGTPVIDPATGELYLVARNQQTTAAGTVDQPTLHALNLNTDAEQDLHLGSGGVLLAPSLPGGPPDRLIGGGKTGTFDGICLI